MLVAALCALSFAGSTAASHGAHGYILSPASSIDQLDVVTLAYNASTAATISGEITLDGVRIGNYTRALPAGNSTFSVNTTGPTNMSGEGWRTLRATFDDGTTVVEDARPVHYRAPHVWLTSPGMQLEQFDEVGVSYFDDNGNVSVTIDLDGIIIGEFSSFAGFYQNWSWYVDVSVPLNVQKGWKTLRATFQDDVFTLTDARPMYYRGPAPAPSLQITNASYLVGSGFRLSGTLGWANPIASFTATTEYGTVNLTPQNPWTTAIDVFPTHEGNHTIVVQATDVLGQTTTRNVTVNVRAQNVTIFARNVTTVAGSYAELVFIDLPPRLISGRATFALAGAADIEGTIEADDTTLCLRADGDCTFSTREGPGNARFTWAQGPLSSARLTIVGKRL